MSAADDLRRVAELLDAGLPKPLTIDGHAYHRKTRARRKRRNR
jgi:hypothetical protein